MAGPWEKFKESEPKAQADGPWKKFQPEATESGARQKIADLPSPSLQEGVKNVVNLVSGDGGAIGEGVPILGPLARKAGEYFRAGVDTAIGDKPFSENLERVQGENVARQQKFATENPKTDIARKIIGGIGGAGATPIPGMGVTGRVVGPLTRIAGTTAISAGDTAVRGGDAEAIRRSATLAGGAQAAVESIPLVGRVAAPVTKPLAEGVEAIGSKISESGFGRAAKAIAGNLKANWKSLGGEEKAAKIGQEAMESGAVKLGSSAGAMGRRLEKSADEAWAKVDQAFEAAEKAGVKVEGADIAARIRADAAKIEKVPKNESRIADLEREAAYYESKGQMSLREAQNHKNNYEWKTVDKLKDVLGKNGNNLVNRAIGTSIKESGSKVAKDFVQNYQRSGAYGGMAKAAKATSDQQTRTRSPFSLTDYIVGGAGGTAAAALTGDKGDATIAGFALATANSLARTRGNSTLAVSLTNLGRVIQGSPERLGKFYGVLEKAAQGGQASLAAAHATLLNTEPEYRKAIEQQSPPSKMPGSMPIAPNEDNNPMSRRLGE